MAYCATCDGEFFTDKDVFVVGGGFAAAEESVFLTKYARHVTILIRGDGFTCAQATADAARNHEKITVLTNTVVEEVSGDTALRFIRYRNTRTGQVTKHHAADGETFGVFVFAGYEPATELVQGLAELDEQGYVLTDRSQKTTADGLYAAGDVCVKSLRQVVTAVGDGALAATELERLCAAMQARTGLRPQQPVSRAEEAAAPAEAGSTLFNGDMLSQLHTVFARMASPLILRLFLDETPLSAELRQYMDELAAQSGKLSVEVGDPASADHLPCVRVCRADGDWTGLAFHGVPGGHEFTSFVLGLYNAAGPGQALDEESRNAIHAIRKNNGSSGVGVPLLHHVPRTGDRRPACCRGKSEHHRPGLRPEPLSRPAGKVPGHERPLPGGQQRGAGLLWQEEHPATVGIADLTEPAVPIINIARRRLEKRRYDERGSTVFGIWLGLFAVLCCHLRDLSDDQKARILVLTP